MFVCLFVFDQNKRNLGSMKTNFQGSFDNYFGPSAMLSCGGIIFSVCINICIIYSASSYINMFSLYALSLI